MDSNFTTLPSQSSGSAARHASRKRPPEASVPERDAPPHKTARFGTRQATLHFERKGEIIPEECEKWHREKCNCPVQVTPAETKCTIIKQTFPGSENSLIIDLTQIPFDELISPSTEGRQEYRTDLFDRVRAFCSGRIKQDLQPILSSEFRPDISSTRSALIKLPDLIDTIIDIRTYMPGLLQISERLSTNLKPDVKAALEEKHSSCKDAVYHDSRYCHHRLSTTNSIDDHNLRLQKLFSVPSFKQWMDKPPIKKGRILNSTLISMIREAGIRICDPRTLVGYILPSVADTVFSRHMVKEDSGNINFWHGKHSHLIQILCNLINGELSHDLLKAIIHEKAWDGTYDNLVQAFSRIPIEDTKAKRKVIYHGVNECLTALSPECLHGLLMQRKVSKAILNISKCTDSERKKSFISTFKSCERVSTKELNSELQYIYKNVVILESYIIDTQYKDLKKNGHSDIPFHRDVPVTMFVFNEDYLHRHFGRAEYYVKKERVVYAVYGRLANGNKCKITTTEQIEKLKKSVFESNDHLIGFVVLPRGVDNW